MKELRWASRSAIVTCDFITGWVAAARVNKPIVKAVLVNNSLSLGLTVVSLALIIEG